METKIPSDTIGWLSGILEDYYSHSELNELFLRASAPENSPPGNNKKDKIRNWLQSINKYSEEPLKVLGNVIMELMDKDTSNRNEWRGGRDEYNDRLRENQDKIRQSLSKNGLTYSRGGIIIKEGSAATISLQETASRWGLSSVGVEIKRALGEVEGDPLAAVHRAGSVLESSFKAYLGHHQISYKEASDGLSDLWKKVVDHAGIHPQDMDEKDLKKIASGLFQIVDGTMHLRNKKSAAHGKSEDQMKRDSIRPRHARLVIHAAHTVSLYVLELMEGR